MSMLFGYMSMLQTACSMCFIWMVESDTCKLINSSWFVVVVGFVSVCVYVRVCVHACVRACVCVHVRVRVCCHCSFLSSLQQWAHRSEQLSPVTVWHFYLKTEESGHVYIHQSCHITWMNEWENRRKCLALTGVCTMDILCSRSDLMISNMLNSSLIIWWVKIQSVGEKTL